MYKSPPQSSLQTTPSRSESDVQKLCQEEGLSPEHITQRGNKRRRPMKDGSYMDRFEDKFLGLKNDIKSDLKDLINELISSQNTRMDKFEEHILEIKSQYSSIEATNQEIEKSMTAVSDQLISLETKIASLEIERNSMARKLVTLEERLDNIDRNCIKTCIEVRNVPKCQKETKSTLYTLVQSLSKQLEANIQPADIRDVSRLPSRKESKTSNITIEFTNTLQKSNFLLAAKQFNINHSTDKINSTHLGLNGPKTPIYIAEQLTPLTKKLFYEARNFAKLNRFAFCWTSNGRVMLKKTVDGQYIIIKNEQQLLQMSQSANI